MSTERTQWLSAMTGPKRAERGRLIQRAWFVSAPALLWVGYSVIVAAYAVLRSVCDEVLPPQDPEHFERSLFGGLPTIFLQSHLYPGNEWLDYAGFLAHISWFFAPLVFGLVVTLVERRRLMEYLGWLIAMAYLSDVFFFLFPATPPWMTEGVHRILLERSFIQYTGLDNNQFAAFPSLHAGLPMVIGLFFLLRCTRTRWVGWIAVAYSLLVSFAVVYLGEHWVIDVLGGWGLAAIVAWLFVSQRVRREVSRIPGDPLPRLIRLNDRLSSYNVATLDPPNEVEVDEGERVAA